MKAHPSKFKFMVMSSEYIEPQELSISDGVCHQSQTYIKVSRATNDHRLAFEEHTRLCTLEEARQLHALSWVSRYLNSKSKVFFTTVSLPVILIIAPTIVHFCKLEKIQERSLRILFNDYESDVHDLFDSTGGHTLALRRLRYMLLEVYKRIKKMNASCLHNLGNSNTVPYQLRTSTFEQPLRRTTKYGLRIFCNVGSY